MRRISRFSKEFLLSQSTEKLREGTFPCFTNFLVSQKIMDKRGRTEGVSQDILSNFFVSRYQKISCGNLSVFHKISGIEKLYG